MKGRDNMLQMVVLASGRGSNFQAIHQATEEGRLKGQVSLVLSDKPDAGVLQLAKEAGIPAEVVLPAEYDTWAAYEAALLASIAPHACDVVVLAGYMRMLGATFLEGVNVPVLNIHPSLLPAFPGLHAQRQAVEYGVKVSGCSVHFVDPTLDGGPIIAQRVVPLEPGDTEESLSERILVEEHALYSEVLQWLAEDRLHVEGRLVHIDKGE